MAASKAMPERPKTGYEPGLSKNPPPYVGGYGQRRWGGIAALALVGKMVSCRNHTFVRLGKASNTAIIDGIAYERNARSGVVPNSDSGLDRS
jgi:hypothetical protein